MCRLADALRTVLDSQPNAVVLTSLPIRGESKIEWRVSVFRGVVEVTATRETAEAAIETVAEAIRRGATCH